MSEQVKTVCEEEGLTSDHPSDWDLINCRHRQMLCVKLDIIMWTHWHVKTADLWGRQDILTPSCGTSEDGLSVWLWEIKTLAVSHVQCLMRETHWWTEHCLISELWTCSGPVCLLLIIVPERQTCLTTKRRTSVLWGFDSSDRLKRNVSVFRGDKTPAVQILSELRGTAETSVPLSQFMCPGLSGRGRSEDVM